MRVLLLREAGFHVEPCGLNGADTTIVRVLAFTKPTYTFACWQFWRSLSVSV
jgi:hypothetical protein